MCKFDWIGLFNFNIWVYCTSFKSIEPTSRVFTKELIFVYLKSSIHIYIHTYVSTYMHTYILYIAIRSNNSNYRKILIDKTNKDYNKKIKILIFNINTKNIYIHHLNVYTNFSIDKNNKVKSN